MNNALQTTIHASDLHHPDEIIEAVVSAVADADGTPALELRPLATVIDPDALCALVHGGESEVTIGFDYCGYRVSVSGHERITVEVASDD